jgi:alanine dehydrogenase
VTILEVDVERMRFLDITLHTAHTLYSNRQHILDMLPKVDLLIGAVLVPGAKAPKLIDREMMRVMKPGSVFVDIAIDQGGCAETSRPTTHEHPTFVEEDVIHYCVANMPAAFARTSAQALANVTVPYIERLSDLGVPGAFKRDPNLLGGLNLFDGKVTHPAVATALGMEFTDPRQVLGL